MKLSLTRADVGFAPPPRPLFSLSPCLPFSLSPPLLVFLLAAGCDLPGKPSEADRPVPANEVKDFDALYSMHCAGCHGADGKLARRRRSMTRSSFPSSPMRSCCTSSPTAGLSRPHRKARCLLSASARAAR